MSGIYFLLPTLLTIFVSFLVVRAAAIALMMTGLERNRAKFQALSAFSGTGFTTREAESVVNHPSRRRIITRLMIFGNAGIATVIVTSTSSFMFTKEANILITAGALLVGLFVIYILVTKENLVEKWERYVERKLVKSPSFEEGSTEELLHFTDGYGMVKGIIPKRSSLVGKSLIEAKLTMKGILVLGIERSGNWLPIPKPNETIEVDDRLVVYGSLDILHELF
jgi:hypothetical protein